jgi:hypothetical protein
MNKIENLTGFHKLSGFLFYDLLILIPDTAGIAS